MARSPESAKAKDAAAEEVVQPTKEDPKDRLLRGPDGFVYVWTEALAKQEGFSEFTGKVGEDGFAKE